MKKTDTWNQKFEIENDDDDTLFMCCAIVFSSIH